MSKNFFSMALFAIFCFSGALIFGFCLKRWVFSGTEVLWGVIACVSAVSGLYFLIRGFWGDTVLFWGGALMIVFDLGLVICVLAKEALLPIFQGIFA